MAFRFDKLTLKSQEAVQKAQDLARERGHQRLEPMHLLVALLDPDQAVVRALLMQFGVKPEQILRAAEEGLEALPKVTGGETTLGPELDRVFDAAQDEADRMKDQYVSVEHLLLGLTRVKSRAQDVLAAVGVTDKDAPPGTPEGARRAARHGPEPRGQIPGAGAVRPRPRRARAARGRWTRSSAATPRSAASSRSSRGGPRTTPS